MFFDLSWSTEKKLDLSRVNPVEVDFTFQLIQSIINFGGNKGVEPLVKRIGVVTPYKGQVRLLRTKLDQYLYAFNCKKNDLNINTVDAY